MSRKGRAPHRRNPRGDARPAAEIERAAQLFRGFRESEPGKVTRLELRLPRAAMVVGELHAIAYSTDHGGKREQYLHQFKRGARPVLLAAHDGRSLIIYGGNFVFSERGIVDKGGRSR
jgi:hypothetical protein